MILDPETKLEVVKSFLELKDEKKKKLGKINEAKKMTLLEMGLMNCFFLWFRVLWF